MTALRHRPLTALLAGLRTAGEWVVVVLGVGIVLVAVAIPKLAHATPYTVLTGSMRPGMPPGTLVVVRPVDPTDITVGSVITYQPKPDDPEVITHRVVSQGFDVTGRPVFRTQGDDNPAPDPAPVHDYQVVGERWYFVPYLGYLTRVLDQRERAFGQDVVVAGLFGYSLWMFVGALRDARRRAKEPAHA